MSAKRPRTDHGRALAAFVRGQITRREYQLCCIGDAWVSGRGIYLPDGAIWGWHLRPFASAPGKAAT